MSLTDKTIANSYKDLLQLDNSNNGVGVHGNLVKDGEGNSSMLSLGQRNSTIKPVSANHTQSFRVQNLSGNNKLNVDLKSMDSFLHNFKARNIRKKLSRIHPYINYNIFQKFIN